MPKTTVHSSSGNTSPAARREFERLAATLAKKESAVDRRETRRERGLKKLTESVGVQGGKVMNQLVEFSPDLARYIVDFAYGDVIGRDKLDDRTRALVVVAALAALGNAQPQLQVHIGTALNSGCTREEILEVMLVVSVYAGFPAALNGMATAKVAFGESRQPKSRRKRHG